MNKTTIIVSATAIALLAGFLVNAAMIAATPSLPECGASARNAEYCSVPAYADMPSYTLDTQSLTPSGLDHAELIARESLIGRSTLPVCPVVNPDNCQWRASDHDAQGPSFVVVDGRLIRTLLG